MARPQKIGLEYYPQDTDIHSDRKIRRLITEFGATGYLVYDYIKCLCYKENGYWVQYDEGFCFDVSDALKSGTTENSVLEILKGCFRMSLFNAEVFKAFQIITASGIQKRYLKIKKNGVISPELQCFDEKTGVIDDETQENDEESTQRKEKESKVKEKKKKFADMLAPFVEELGKDTVNSFYSYWAEANEKTGKLRWEMEKTWETPKRLSTWVRNEQKFERK